MKLFHYAKDGGPESPVHGFWLVESKSFFSIALLRFSNGSRDCFHSHAFTSWNWVLKGSLVEQLFNTHVTKQYKPSFRPIKTWKSTFHRVVSKGTSWVLSIRGPWDETWEEYDPKSKCIYKLTHGRKIVSFSTKGLFT